MAIRVRLILVHHHVSVRRRRVLLSVDRHRTVSDVLREISGRFDRHASRFCHAAVDGFSLPLDEVVGRVVVDSDCLKIHLYVTVPADFDPAIHLAIEPVTPATPYQASSRLDIDSAWGKISPGDLITYRLRASVDEFSEHIAEARTVGLCEFYVSFE